MRQVERRCPYCNAAMRGGVKSISWGDKSYDFPRKLYWCRCHGFFMWKGMEGNVFMAPWEFEREATSVKSKTSDAHDRPFDYSEVTVIRVRCDSCDHIWRMLLKPEALGNTECPVCGMELLVEKAVREAPQEKLDNYFL